MPVRAVASHRVEPFVDRHGAGRAVGAEEGRASAFHLLSSGGARGTVEARVAEGRGADVVRAVQRAGGGGQTRRVPEGATWAGGLLARDRALGAAGEIEEVLQRSSDDEDACVDLETDLLAVVAPFTCPRAVAGLQAFRRSVPFQVQSQSNLRPYPVADRVSTPTRVDSPAGRTLQRLHAALWTEGPHGAGPAALGHANVGGLPETVGAAVEAPRAGYSHAKLTVVARLTELPLTRSVSSMSGRGSKMSSRQTFCALCVL